MLLRTEETEKIVVSWEWVGGDALTEGVLALSDVTAEKPVTFDSPVWFQTLEEDSYPICVSQRTQQDGREGFGSCALFVR